MSYFFISGFLSSNDVFGSDTQEVVGPGDRLFPEIDLTGTQSISGGIGPYWYNNQTDIQNKDLYDFSVVFGRIDSELLSVRIGHVEGCAGTLTTTNAANKLAPFETKTEELFAINAVGLETGVAYTFKLDGTDERVVNINQNYVGQNGYIHIPTDYVIGVGAKDSSKTHTDIQYKNITASGTPGFMYDMSNSGTLTQSYSYLNITFHIPTITEETTYHFDEMIKPEDEIQSDIISGLVNDVEDLKAGASSLKGKYLSIIGDSISTYQGWNNVDPIPDAAVYYPHGSIDNVNKTYWKKLIDRTGMNLLVNNSWSGSAVCYYKTAGDVANTPARTVLHKDGHNPDIILINMGTNDFYRLGLSSQAQGVGTLTIGTWNGRGEQYPDKTLQSVNFRIAYAVMLRRVIEAYPRAEVYCCTVPCGEESGGGLNEFNQEGDSLVEFNDAIREIATAYGVKVIELATTGINYASRTDYLVDSAVHPNEAGMERFYEVIRASLESKLTTTTSAIRTSAYVKSNQGAAQSGKILGIDSTGNVVPVTASGGSVVTPAGQASVFDDSEPVNLFGTHMESGSEATEGDRVFADIITTGTLAAGAGLGPYWYKDQTALQNQKLYSFSVVFTRIDSQPLHVRIGQVSGSGGSLTTSNANALLPYATNTQILFSVDASGLQEGVRYDFLLDGSDSRIININQNFVEDGYIKIPTDYVVAAGASSTDDPNKEHTDIYYHRTDASDTNPQWVFCSNGSSMTQSSCTLNYCFHLADFDEVEVYNFDTYLKPEGEGIQSQTLSDGLMTGTKPTVSQATDTSDIVSKFNSLLAALSSRNIVDVE